MIFLIILGVITVILFIILFAPVETSVSYFDEFKFKISFLKIPVYKSSEKKKKVESQAVRDEKREEPKAKNYFVRLKEKHGFTQSIKLLMGFTLDVLKAIKWLLKHITINKVRLQILIGTADAASTAIEYGVICNAVYPVTAALSSAEVGFKEINVNADFEGQKSDFGFSLAVKLQIFYLLIAAIKILILWKKFITENLENERK